MGQFPLCVNAYWNMQWNWNKTWQLPAVLVPKTSWVIWWCPPGHNTRPNWGEVIPCSAVRTHLLFFFCFCLTAGAASLGVQHCLDLLLHPWTDTTCLYQNSYLQIQPNLFHKTVEKYLKSSFGSIDGERNCLVKIALGHHSDFESSSCRWRQCFVEKRDLTWTGLLSFGS